ncbi:hypothetical protein R3W88_014310 [Solanum pinnatisectum]|uniref:Uncharacterized protein n=1 Tax=Solanum pinnatisectum TaxID=50273 RepID=A0AAV9KRC8_9SOLN|nr:hypothetical protein R3W88_014310 [Solanum pinnatisectum]
MKYTSPRTTTPLVDIINLSYFGQPESLSSSTNKSTHCFVLSFSPVFLNPLEII